MSDDMIESGGSPTTVCASTEETGQVDDTAPVLPPEGEPGGVIREKPGDKSGPGGVPPDSTVEQTVPGGTKPVQDNNRRLHR